MTELKFQRPKSQLAVQTSVYRKAKVLVQGKEAGILAETEDGYRFQYLEEYLTSKNPLAVSLTLPLSRESYKATGLFPFFDGLIPEGWTLYEASRHWGIPERDRFGILLKACRDCIGDVQIFEEEK